MSNTPVLKSGITLATIAAICTAMVALTYGLTAGRIAANQKAWLEQSLAPALSDISYDSGITDSMIVIAPPHSPPGSEEVVIYRVFNENEPVAALFVVTARDGYAGPIRFLVGIDIHGAVTGVHILEHRETPGLGDRIESTRSDWVRQFEGRSLGNPAPAGWRIKSDGGRFDGLTGASVTPRAVVKAIRLTLLYFAENKDRVFADGNEKTGLQGETS